MHKENIHAYGNGVVRTSCDFVDGDTSKHFNAAQPEVHAAAASHLAPEMRVNI